MNKIALFMFDEMTDYEITFITHLLHADAGKDVIAVSFDGQSVKGRSGLRYEIDKKVSELVAEELDGIIICGGWFGELRIELQQLLMELNLKKKLIAGICGAGTLLLAKAGMLKNVQYTTPISEWDKKYQELFGTTDPFPRANFIAKRVVRDRNVITAHGNAFIDFAIEICDFFSLFSSEQEKSEFSKNIIGAI